MRQMLLDCGELRWDVFLPEPFLPCSVPNLQFDHFVDHADNLRAKLHSDCVVGFILN